jgi:Zn-finger nucleic acid-binding protein
MKCPIDDSPLSVSSREGVEIDYCPQCRGVWLDRGELDKIIDRLANSLASAPTAYAPSPAPPTAAERPRYDERGYDGGGYDDRYDDRKRKKKRSFLDDLFDFD